MNDRFFEDMLIKSARGATLPWKSMDALPPVKIGRAMDSQAQIDKCLSCSKCDCTNCLHGRKSKYVSKKVIALKACAEA